MATTFLEPGGDADFGFNLWSTTVGPPTIVSDFVHGNHARSIKFAPNAAQKVVSANSVLADAGTRMSFWLYVNAKGTNGSATIIQFQTSGGSTCFMLELTSGNALVFNDGSFGQLGSVGGALSTAKWYRISVSYVITSSTVNTIKLFIDGKLSITLTNVTLTAAATSRFIMGNNDGDATMDLRVSDFYVDNVTDIKDPGNIWVTAKRPFSNGTINGFTTQIGAGGSGYGSGHTPQVNERALSTTNGWSMVGAGSAVTEEYSIETVHQGDIDMIDSAIVDFMGWVYASALVSETAQIIVAGVNTNISLTSSNTMFIQAAGSVNYPSGGTDIGIITATTLTTVSLYECGIVVAYIPTVYGTTTSTSSTSSTSSSISSTSSSTSSTSTSISSTSSSTSSTSSSVSTSSTSSSISSTSSSTSSTSTSSTSSSTSISSTSSSISSTSISSTSISSTSSSTSISSTSSSFSSTSSSISSTSFSTSSTSISSTSSSSSTSTTAIPLNLDYTYQDTLTLPTPSADDIDIDTSKNVQNVSVDDGDYFTQFGSEFMPQTYKRKNTNNTDTPTFTFKGRSTESTAISPVIIQIYNASVSNSNPIDSYSESNADASHTLGAGGFDGTISAQGFVGNGSSLTQAKFYLSQNASPIGNCVAVLYASTGTLGTDATPTGSALATSNTIDTATLSPSGSPSLVTFNFSGPNQVKLTSATNYFIGVQFTGAGSIVVRFDNSSPTHSGNLAEFSGGWTAQPTQDNCFYVYGSAWETLAVVNKIPADTDFQVIVSQSTNVSNYYDSNNTVTFRSYQLVI